MDRYEKSAEFIMKRGDEMIAKRKRRRTMILRSCAVGAGAAAVLGVGLTTFALRPPKKPTPSQSGIIVETETTSAETTAAPTTSGTTAPQTVTTGQGTTVTTTATSSSTRQTSTIARSTTKASRTTTAAARTTEAAATTTAAVQTSPPTVTSLTPTTEDIEERIANIIMRMPEMITVAKALPAVDEDGNRIPTFPMIIGDDRIYLKILQYDRGELDYPFDLNDDGIVDIYDVFEYEAYSFCRDQYNRAKKYPYNFDMMFPDMEVFERAAQFSGSGRNTYLLTYYMIYHNIDIPDTETIEEKAREYAGSRPFPDYVFKNCSENISKIKQSFDGNYEQYYEALNRKEEDYPEFLLTMFKKIDSGELFPDADQDGSVGYMDIYYIFTFYADKSTGYSKGLFSESQIEWIEGHCDLDGDGWVNSKECTWLMNYLFFYKKYDYVTHIEMEMEYRASQVPEDPVITIKPNS